MQCSTAFCQNASLLDQNSPLLLRFCCVNCLLAKRYAILLLVWGVNETLLCVGLLILVPISPLWYDHSLLLSSNYTVKERCNMMLTVLICLCWSDSTLFLFIAGYNYPSAKFPCATHDYFPEISTFIPLYPCPCLYVQGTTWCCLNGCGHA